MALSDTIASILGKVNAGVLSGLKETFTQQTFVAEDAGGTPQYNPTTVSLTAVRDSVNIMVPQDGGTKQGIASDRLQFATDTVIKVRDHITFADGSSGDVLRVRGTTNPSTGRPYAPEVLVGTRGSDA